MTRRTPLTPIFDEEPRRGSVVVGNTPGTPVTCVPSLTLTGFLTDPTPSIWDGDSTGLLIDGNYAYVMSYFFGAGRINGIAIVDISTPASPSLVSTFTSSDSVYMDQPNAAVKDGNYLYVACHGSDALVILDVSTPATPTFVGQANGLITGFPSSPDGLVKDGNNVFTAGSNRGIVTFDVTTPASPTVTGQNATSGFNLFDVVKIGNYLFATDEGTTPGLKVFDVSTPASPSHVTTLADALIGSDPRELVASGNTLFVACRGTDRVVAVDVSTPGSPSILGSVFDASILNGAHGLHLDGTYLYVTANAGDHLSVVDVSNPASMTIVDSVDDAVDFSLSAGAGVGKSGQYLFVNGLHFAVVANGCP